jgi:succinyl-diaminopimelate desuccinylase
VADKKDLEREILDLIDEEEVIKLAADLIKFPSENPPGNLSGITDYVCNYLSENNIEYKIKEAKEGWPIIIGELEGEEPGKTLILNGHLDVVPAGDKSKWEVEPFSGEIKGEYLHGRGASDMKAGSAGIIAAFKAASQMDALPGKLILMLVPDEETGGHLGSGWIVEEEDFSADGCLIAEPSKQDPTIGQKGSCWLKLITRGVPGHGSLSPAVNGNAILEMNRAVDAVYQIWEKDWEMPKEIEEILEISKDYLRENKSTPGLERILDHVTVNVGIINGGDKVNKIPDYCEAEIDMRLPFGVKTEDVLNWIKNKFKEEGISAEIETLRWNSEANYTLPDENIVKSVVNCAERLSGKKSRAMFQWASSDARYFREKGIATIQFGPAELDGIHSYNEKVKVKEVKDYAKMYGAIIVDFLAQ